VAGGRESRPPTAGAQTTTPNGHPGGPEPGISRNAYGLLGSASVLIELRGDIAQKSNGYIAKTAYVASASVVDALADSSLFTTSTQRAEEMPAAARASTARATSWPHPERRRSSARSRASASAQRRFQLDAGVPRTATAGPKPRRRSGG